MPSERGGLFGPLSGGSGTDAEVSDRAFLQNYLQEVRASKALLYSTCDRLGLTYWRSSANFVLVRADGRLEALLTKASERRIYLRDRSTEPGCAGCVRIGTGLVAHTRQVIGVMEEVLCAAP